MSRKKTQKRDWKIFFCSVFFVLGFSFVFSLLGVLLQGVFVALSGKIQDVLSKIAGVLIILLGIYLFGFIKIPFLETERRITLRRKYKSTYVMSFVAGAAFAVGWTPCIGPVLGSVLLLAASEPSQAFFLMFSYSVGLSIPFLLVGLFVNEARSFIQKAGKVLRYVNIVFGTLLIYLGYLVFTRSLDAIASWSFLTSIFSAVPVGEPTTTITLGVAFVFGFLSFLSPCVMPLIPAFLTYIASVAVRTE